MSEDKDFLIAFAGKMGIFVNKKGSHVLDTAKKELIKRHQQLITPAKPSLEISMLERSINVDAVAERARYVLKSRDWFPAMIVANQLETYRIAEEMANEKRTQKDYVYRDLSFSYHRDLAEILYEGLKSKFTSDKPGKIIERARIYDGYGKLEKSLRKYRGFVHKIAFEGFLEPVNEVRSQVDPLALINPTELMG